MYREDIPSEVLKMADEDHHTFPPMPKSCAIILAGGASSRFGSDKLNVEVGGYKLLDRVMDVAATVVDEVLVVGRVHLGATSIEEPGPRLGPLNAISYGLAFAAGDSALVLAGDHPYLSSNLLALLLDSLGDSDAVVPVDRSGHAQPLVACYRPKLRMLMSAAIESGVRGVREFLDYVDVRWLPPEEWARVDPEGLSFMDIDTVADLNMLVTPTGIDPDVSGTDWTE